MFKVITVIGSIFLILIFILFSTTDFKKLTVVSKDNTTKTAINLKPNKYKDRYCNMTIKDTTYASQVVLPNNDTLFFDDIGCLVFWLNDQKNPEKFILWVWAKDTNKYINAREAWYSQTENTPMHYGFGAYKNKQTKHMNFKTMYMNVLLDQTFKNPEYREKLLGNH